MAKLRVVKIFNQRDILTRDGRRIYLVDTVANLVVNESEEHLINIVSDFPLIQEMEYEAPLHGIRIRLRQARDFPFPGIPVPGIQNPMTVKIPKGG